ncbi:MAG: N-acetylmuramoyl-L-alanine amidase [Muribaculaceae bacterium]|nr:N-acetylmuramoyl-L-alanine amidase [Bacteroidales bacterium]MDD6943756.1 N-acetylmuramoyl-L-alanine amidase [Bacteroidales bacterium]MDY2733480.1 N-acetylmuramoyl-L-alanine amidase [Muribaculaceae bacterium]MDY4649686.1 N-acetylmuramoyl-L-alanine amidase [Muribaculaceae bacterium]MDY5388322.1 N-acetylmuramoyl-L-alanine amidase [Muribaculaceae bacterium]
MRKIDKIILHCTATPEGREVTVADVTAWHKERGFRTIGYHYLVYLDGTVVRGRREEEIGAHCLGQNAGSIGVCYVGGLDSRGKPKDTRTAAQRVALRNLVEGLQRRYPHATLHGHNEFAAKACPCFKISDL